MAGSGTAHLQGNALLSAAHLVKTYKAKGGRRVQALSDVSLDIVRGETLGVVGESGSGKSTLARAILALPKPDAGAVQFEEKPVFDAKAAALRALRHRMQMVFQDPLSSLNPCTASASTSMLSATGDPTSCRAASASGSASRVRWCCSPVCWSATSRSRLWTSRCKRRSSTF